MKRNLCNRDHCIIFLLWSTKLIPKTLLIQNDSFLMYSSLSLLFSISYELFSKAGHTPGALMWWKVKTRNIIPLIYMFRMHLWTATCLLKHIILSVCHHRLYALISNILWMCIKILYKPHICTQSSGLCLSHVPYPLLLLHFSSPEARHELASSEMSDSFYTNASSLLHFFFKEHVYFWS